MRKIILLTALLIFGSVGFIHAELGLEIDQIMEPQTAAKTKEIDVTRDMIPSIIIVDGTMAGLEAITILQWQSDGTYVNIKEAGSEIIMNIDQNYYAVYAPCRIQFSKSITANAVGIIWYRK